MTRAITRRRPVLRNINSPRADYRPRRCNFAELRQSQIASGRPAGYHFSTFKLNDMNPVFLFLGNLSAGELTVIFLIVLLLFGGNKIPELMRGLGKGIREFNNAKNTVEDEIRQGIRDAEKKPLENKSRP